jgi:uncharacterized protein (DUF2147 family)
MNELLGLLEKELAELEKEWKGYQMDEWSKGRAYTLEETIKKVKKLTI